MRLFTVNIVEKYDAKIQQNEWIRKMANASRIVRQCTNLMHCKKHILICENVLLKTQAIVYPPRTHVSTENPCNGAAVALKLASFEHTEWPRICCELTTAHRIELFKVEVFNYIA